MPSLQERVNEALKNMLDNGYENMLEEPICILAAYMANCTPELEDEPLDDIIQAIENWQLAQQSERI